MRALPISVAWELWRNAPQWRLTVTAAVFLTVGSVLYGSLGGGGGRPATTDYDPTIARSRGAVPPDPASDARLATYESIHEEALKITNAAQRCEKLAPSIRALEDRDRARAHHPAAPRNRAIAVTDGERCARDIAASDGRWRALQQAVADATRSSTGASVARAVELGRSLTDFDRSRSIAAAQAPVLARVAALTKEFESSEKRVAEAAEASAALSKEGTPANIARAAQAWQSLTDFDRNRLTPEGRAAVAPAREAAATIALSRGKLRRLEQSVAAVQDANPSPQARRQLVDALAAVTDTDRAIATNEQKATIQAAEQRVASVGWSILEEAASDLKRDTTPANSERLASLWALLRERLPAPSSAAQTESAQAARGAVAALASSDERLAALVNADAVWRKNRSDAQAQRLVADSLREVTDFDQKRFNEPQRRAWDNLSLAEMVIRGPELKAPLPKARLPILVTTGGQSATDSRFANDIKTALKDAGFLIVANEADSAIAMEIAAERVTDPTPDYSGTIVGFRVDAVVNVHAVWTVDSSDFLSAKATGSARGTNSDRGLLQTNALRAAIAEVVRRTDARMQNGS